MHKLSVELRDRSCRNLLLMVNQQPDDKVARIYFRQYERMSMRMERGRSHGSAR
jgi:hypothetical protein